MIKKVIIYSITAIWYAFVFFWATQQIYYQVGFDVLRATIWNTVLIVALVIWDKVEDRIYVRLKPKNEKDKIGFFRRILLYYHSGACFKTSLYLFYFVMLICNALVSASPDFPILYRLTDYFKTVYYGILILFAADTFLTRLLDDVSERRLKNLESKQKIKEQSNE